MMKLIDRKKCVVDGSKDFETLQESKNFPVFMGCVEHPIEKDIFADMVWKISKQTGTIQLSKLIP